MNKATLVQFIIIIILLVTITVFGFLLNKEKVENQILINRQNVSKTVEGIENPGNALIEKHKAENDVIDREIDTIDKKIKDVKKLQGNNIPDTKKVQDEIQTMDLNTLVDQFHKLGHSVSITRQ